MKKSTLLIIFIVYLASIVVIGFFGMRVKVYDEIKYVKSIEMSVEGEKKEMFKFESLGVDSVTKQKKYKLTIFFDENMIGTFERQNGVVEERRYVPLTLIPYVTYDTGDIANSVEESISYSISNENLISKELVSINNRGALMVFKRGIAFVVYVNPATITGNGTGVTIDVYII